MPGELEQQFRAIVAEQQADFRTIVTDPRLGIIAAQVYLSFLWLRAQGRCLGTPSRRRNLRRIHACVLANWNELREAIEAELGADRVPVAR